MTPVLPHPSVVRNAEAVVAAAFAMPVSQGVRSFLRAYLLSTPVGREALVGAAERRLRAALVRTRATA